MEIHKINVFVVNNFPDVGVALKNWLLILIVVCFCAGIMMKEGLEWLEHTCR